MLAASTVSATGDICYWLHVARANLHVSDFVLLIAASSVLVDMVARQFARAYWVVTMCWLDVTGYMIFKSYWRCLWLRFAGYVLLVRCSAHFIGCGNASEFSASLVRDELTIALQGSASNQVFVSNLFSIAASMLPWYWMVLVWNWLSTNSVLLSAAMVPANIDVELV